MCLKSKAYLINAQKRLTSSRGHNTGARGGWDMRGHHFRARECPAIPCEVDWCGGRGCPPTHPTPAIAAPVPQESVSTITPPHHPCRNSPSHHQAGVRRRCDQSCALGGGCVAGGSRHGRGSRFLISAIHRYRTDNQSLNPAPTLELTILTGVESFISFPEKLLER